MTDVLFELYRRKDLTRKQLLENAKNQYKNTKDNEALGTVLCTVPISRQDYRCYLPIACFMCQEKNEECHIDISDLYQTSDERLVCKSCLQESDSFKEWKELKEKDDDNNSKKKRTINNLDMVETILRENTLDILIEKFVKENEMRKVYLEQYSCSLCQQYQDDDKDFLYNCVVENQSGSQENDREKYCYSCVLLLKSNTILSELSCEVPIDICNIISSYLSDFTSNNFLHSLAKRKKDLNCILERRMETTSKFLPKPAFKKLVQSIASNNGLGEKVFETIDYGTYSVLRDIVDDAQNWIREVTDDEEEKSRYNVEFILVDGWPDKVDIVLYHSHSFLPSKDILCRQLSGHFNLYATSSIKEYVAFVNETIKDEKVEEEEKKEKDESRHFSTLVQIKYSNLYKGDKGDKDLMEEFKLLLIDAFNIIKKDCAHWLPNFTSEEINYVEIDEENEDADLFVISLLKPDFLKKSTKIN
jgi:hypothetical protein